MSLPSRHLGLVPAPEHGAAAAQAVSTLAELMHRHVDLDAVLALARSAPARAVPAWSPADAIGVHTPHRPLIAVAGGSAFTFSYAETVEMLAAAGADVALVDPLRDESLPDGTAGLVVGGGFPEVHAAELSANAPLRADVARLAASGAPIWAECAGLLYLAQTLDGSPMCGVLPVEARMTPALTLGYRDACRPDGGTLRAHEFHRTRCTPAAGAAPAYTLADGTPEGFVSGRVRASYLHVHPVGCPAVVRDLLPA